MKGLFGDPVSFRKGRLEVLGCARCPQSKETRVKPIIDTALVKGRPVMVWGSHPTKRDNDAGKLFSGAAGNLLWRSLDAVGVTRAQCDAQVVMRCWPWRDGAVQKPGKAELRCCSVYNEDALHANGQKAVVHLMLGDVAADQILERGYKQGGKAGMVVWSDELRAYVVRSYNVLTVARATEHDWSAECFATRMRAVAAVVAHPGRYGFIKAQNYGAVRTVEEFKQLAKILRAQAKRGRRISVDIEDSTIDGKHTVLCIGFGWGRYASEDSQWNTWRGGARAVVLEHPEADKTPERLEPLKAAIAELLTDPSVGKVFQHGSYDVDAVRKYFGVKLQGYTFDTQYGAYLFRSHLRRYGLAHIIDNFIPEFGDYKTTLAQEYFGKFHTMPLDKMVLYNCADCDATKRAEAMIAPQVRAELVQVYIHTARTMDRMEHRGPLLDVGECDRISKEVDQLYEKKLRALREMAGDEEFNPSTPAQVGDLLFKKLGLPRVGGHRTNEEVLKALRQQVDHPAPQTIMDARTLTTIRGTFITGFRRSAKRNNGELRTVWWLTGAATGRLRSGRGEESEKKGIVNFQNIHGNPIIQNLLCSDADYRRLLDIMAPFSKKKGRRLKLSLDRIGELLEKHPELGNLKVFLAADYSQIEVRMLAEISKDPLLIKMFRSGEDVHCLVGHEVTGWPVERIAKDKNARRFVKVFHFALVYGRGRQNMYPHLAAEGIDTTPEQTEAAYDRYFQRFKGVKRLQWKNRRMVEEKGYVESLFGFRRHIYQTEGGSYWGNQAINTPIQGTAHQLLLIAMALLDEEPRKYRPIRDLVMEVHDELVFRVRLRDLVEAYGMLKKLMEDDIPEYVKDRFGIELKVPLLAECKVGFSLGTMVGYKGESTANFLKDWLAKQAEVSSRPITALLKN